YVFIKLFAVLELTAQRIDYGLLVAGERGWVFGLQGWPVGIKQRVALVADCDRAAAKIDLVEQDTFVHGELGVARDDLRIELELDDRNRFVHTRHGDRVVVLEVLLAFGRKDAAWVIGVGLVGKTFECTQADIVAIVECANVAIAQREP